MNVITYEDILNHQDDASEASYIKPASEYKDEIVDRFYNPACVRGAKLPWGKAEFLMQFRPAEVSVWLGYNGHGKSLLLGQTVT